MREVQGIECPTRGESAEKCSWFKQVGSVRDFPDVDVLCCNECGLVTHSRNLSSEVSYKEATMGN